MSTQPQQSYDNHAQMVPGFHYVTGGLTILFLLTSIWRAMTARTIDAHIMMLGAFALLGTFWYARVFPLKAQDRVIRLEEQLRLTQLLPADLQSRIGELSARQLISMRFASDAELPELVRWVLTENVTNGKLIKQRIKTWRPDFHRV
jgi:Family of unknown function (DUF6526)